MEKKIHMIILLLCAVTRSTVCTVKENQDLTSKSGSGAPNETKMTRFGSASKQLMSPYEKQNLRTIFAQIVASRVCEKGMLEFINKDLPYPLTFPSRTFAFPYPCDTATDGGGWIVIQRRTTGDVDFNRTWTEYKNGFGSFAGDFWLGNDKLHTITKSGRYELRIDLVFNGTSVFAHYDDFAVQSETYTETKNIQYTSRDYYRSRTKSVNFPMGYKLSLGAYHGTAGDSMRDNDGRPFSTLDTDRDTSGGNCAEQYNGGWWFVGCGFSCLNGEWGAGINRGMEWRDLTGGLSVSFSEMKIRKVA